MKEVCRLISLKQLFTVPYSQRCKGLNCERISGILKSIYHSAVLFTNREVLQASTGFSPSELLYGRTVCGPMQVLKELWTEKETPEARLQTSTSMC